MMKMMMVMTIQVRRLNKRDDCLMKLRLKMNECMHADPHTEIATATEEREGVLKRLFAFHAKRRASTTCTSFARERARDFFENPATNCCCALMCVIEVIVRVLKRIVRVVEVV